MLILGVDPDSRCTALCLLRYDGHDTTPAEVLGGGSIVVKWSTISGALEYLQSVRERFPDDELLVVIEMQAPKGVHSQDVESLRRVRYHWEAACELLGIECSFVAAKSWQSAVLLPGEVGKPAYMKRTRDLAGDHASLLTNEDRCAAFGIAWAHATSLAENRRRRY